MEKKTKVDQLKLIFITLILGVFSTPSVRAQSSILPDPDIKKGLFVSRDTAENKLKIYISQLEKSFNRLDEIQGKIDYNNFAKDTTDLGALIKKLQLIEASFKLNLPIQPRDLQLYLKMAKEAVGEHARLKISNEKKEKSFSYAKKSLMQIAADPQLNQMVEELGTKNLVKLQPLINKWQETDSIIASASSVTNMQSIKLSATGILIQNLIKQSQERLVKSGIQAFQSNDEKAKTVQNMNSQIGLQQAIINIQILGTYFIDHSYLLFILPVLCVSLLYIWLIKKRKLIIDNGDFLRSKYFGSVYNYPLTCVIFLVINLMPALDFNTPSIYQACIQLMSLILIVRLLRKGNGYGSLKWYYLFYYSLLVFLSLLDSDSGVTSNSIIIANTNIAAIIGIFFIASREHFTESSTIRPKRIAMIFSVPLLISLIAIFSGHTPIAKNLTVAAITVLLQFSCLLLVKKILLDILKLQMIQRRIKLKLSTNVDTSKMEKNLSFPINFAIGLFCILSFANNMTFYALFSTIIETVMSAPIELGSVHITSGSIIYFIIIIMIAHFLRRHIGYMFGDPGIEDENDERVEQSSLVITRLLIITLGYMIAVAVSGLPVDKITIVLGALSVGVGMGFQNVVNNFVSGIILLFERPLKIGDNVQVNGKSGKVKEMGVRTSTLQTEEGAEIIIPNGTILSQDIINWSHSNNRRRYDLQYTLITDKSSTEIESIIIELLLKSHFTLSSPKPIILFDPLGKDEIKIKILFWSKEDRLPEQILSEIKSILFREFYNMKIQVK